MLPVAVGIDWHAKCQVMCGRRSQIPRPVRDHRRKHWL